MDAKQIFVVGVFYVVACAAIFGAAYGLGRRRGVVETVRTATDFLDGLETIWRRRAVEEKGKPSALDVAMELPGIVVVRQRWAEQQRQADRL